MLPLRRLCVALGLLAGCGRVGFDLLGDGASATTDARSADGAFPTANRMFATRTPRDGALGGLAGADGFCQQEADDAGLQGTYVALLSTTTVNAIDRLAGSRGWVRTDGEPVLDMPSELSTRVFNAPDRDASGALVDFPVWTGSNLNGMLGGFGSCADWASTGATASVGHTRYGPPAMLASTMSACTSAYSMLCFGLGANEAIAPIPATGRIAFLAQTRSGPGLAGFDGPCQTAATAAGLPGTYLAAVATTTATARSRFAIDSRPWIRVDGTRIANGGTALFDGSPRSSIVNQRADGTYVSTTLFFLGATSAQSPGTLATTCNDWASMVGSDVGSVGNGYTVDAAVFWSGNSLPCNYGQPILCLQE